MTTIKSQDYDKLRKAGEINGRILATLRSAIKPGMKTRELDAIAAKIHKEEGAGSPFLGYPPGGDHPYPAVINVSVNEELVHGIPGERVIRNGDIVTLDCGTSIEGLIVDSAITVPVGKVEPRYLKLIEATEKALEMAIQMAKPGRTVGDVAFAIASVLRQYHVNIPPPYGGHGVGYALHMPPHMPNFGLPGKGATLQAGMALAIEPMGMYGNPSTRLLGDHWTVVTLDESVCAHTEHTILLHEDMTEILTPLPAMEMTK